MMTLRIIAVSLIVLSALGQSSNKGLQVELSADAKSYKLGEPIIITARLRNVTQGSFWIFKYLLWGRRGGFVLEVNDNSGHKVEAVQLDEDHVLPSTISDAKSYLELAPDYELGIRRRDSTNNLFKALGRYRLRVRYISPVPRKYFPKPSLAWASDEAPIFSVPIEVEIR